MGDEEIAKDRLELERDQEEREKIRNEGKEANRNSFLHFYAWVPLSSGNSGRSLLCCPISERLHCS